METGEIPGRPRPGGSTWQSLTRGTGSLETDYLSGEIALLGRLHGIRTPVNATVSRIAADLAQRREPPGSMTAEQLTVLIDQATSD